MIRHFPPEKTAVGHKQRGHHEFLKTVILLDDETFAEVRAGAIASHCSFAAQARLLIEVGLEAMKEAA